jgi:uncharacterized alkaline shock family protein YloU
MRALDRLISFIFSVIMLIVSVVLILVGIGVVDSQMIIDMLNQYAFAKDMINAEMFNPLTITGIVLFLASLKTTIFLSLFKVKDKSPILVKTPNGEVEIAQETITSTVKNVAMSFENIKDVQARMIKKRKGVAIYAMVLVYANSNIREITEEMQKQVKEVINATTGVNVLEVNIKVKNIYQKQKKNEEPAKVIASKKQEVEAPSEENVMPELENEIVESTEELDQISIEVAEEEQK